MEDQKRKFIAQKKKSFERYKNTQICIDRLNEKIAILDEKITAIRTTNFSDMPRGGEPISISDLLSDKIELEKTVDGLKAENKKLKYQMLSEIYSLENPLYWDVLERLFIDGRSIDDIAYEKGYSSRHIYRMYAKAMDLLVEKLSIDSH